MRCYGSGRIRQNSIDWQNSAEFHGLAEFGRILWLGRIRQVTANCGLCIYVSMAATKEELPVSGVRQLVVTCRRGTSAARSLKLLALPYSRQSSLSTNITVTYSSSRYWWVTLCDQQVLQEVAAAQYILIIYGPAEINGYNFCLGLKSLQIFYQAHPDLYSLIHSVTYLIRQARFQLMDGVYWSDMSFLANYKY